MSLLCKTEKGWLLNHKNAIDEIYQCSVEPNNMNVQVTNRLDTLTRKDEEKKNLHPTVTYRCLPQLFDIQTPFLMDSQFHKLNNMDSEKDDSQVKKNKSKKRKLPLNKGELAAEEYHKEVRTVLTNADDLVLLGIELGYLVEENDGMCKNNNMAARDAAKITGPGDTLKYNAQNDCGRWGENLENIPIITEEDGHLYLLPPNCRYFMSDIQHIEKLVEVGVNYNTIVMDPPWENKSVKRLKRYDSLSDLDLLKLPVPALASDGCLVVVWVTNKQRQQQFVIDQLFPAWGVKQWVRWYWLKVTKHGKPVYNLDSPHKKPYETILLGHVNRDDTEKCCPLLPSDKVIISVPCSIHSRKPPLNAILKDYAAEGNSLELFARNLFPGWTSWGNEVLKFQHTDFFEPVVT